MELTRTYIVNCTGLTPLLMHSDDVEWSDSIKAWRDDPANKRFKVAGDDRSPAWTWIGYLWHDGTVVGIPAEEPAAAAPAADEAPAAEKPVN